LEAARKRMTYKELRIEDLVSWVKSNAQQRNKSAILIEIDNTIASIVNVLLAKKTGLPVHAVIHCDNYEYNWTNLRDLCESLKLYYHVIDSDNHFEDWEYEFGNDNRIVYTPNLSLKNELEKSARIGYIAETSNSLMLGNITRDDYLFVRNYPKINPWDIMPFADLSMAMVNSLFNSLFDKLVITKSREIEAFCKIAPKPNLEIEWLYNANEKSRTLPGDASSAGFGPSIIESESDPTKHPKWYTYTSSQKALISKVHQTEKLTRYKVNSNMPIFMREELDE
jgi:hypothetical protein